MVDEQQHNAETCIKTARVTQPPWFLRSCIARLFASNTSCSQFVQAKNWNSSSYYLYKDYKAYIFEMAYTKMLNIVLPYK